MGIIFSTVFGEAPNPQEDGSESKTATATDTEIETCIQTDTETEHVSPLVDRLIVLLSSCRQSEFISYDELNAVFDEFNISQRAKVALFSGLSPRGVDFNTSNYYPKLDREIFWRENRCDKLKAIIDDDDNDYDHYYIIMADECFKLSSVLELGPIGLFEPPSFFFGAMILSVDGIKWNEWYTTMNGQPGDSNTKVKCSLLFVRSFFRRLSGNEMENQSSRAYAEWPTSTVKKTQKRKKDKKVVLADNSNLNETSLCEGNGGQWSTRGGCQSWNWFSSLNSRWWMYSMTIFDGTWTIFAKIVKVWAAMLLIPVISWVWRSYFCHLDCHLIGAVPFIMVFYIQIKMIHLLSSGIVKITVTYRKGDDTFTSGCGSGVIVYGKRIVTAAHVVWPYTTAGKLPEPTYLPGVPMSVSLVNKYDKDYWKFSEIKIEQTGKVGVGRPVVIKPVLNQNVFLGCDTMPDDVPLYAGDVAVLYIGDDLDEFDYLPSYIQQYQLCSRNDDWQYHDFIAFGNNSVSRFAKDNSKINMIRSDISYDTQDELLNSFFEFDTRSLHGSVELDRDYLATFSCVRVMDNIKETELKAMHTNGLIPHYSQTKVGLSGSSASFSLMSFSIFDLFRSHYATHGGWFSFVDGTGQYRVLNRLSINAQQDVIKEHFNHIVYEASAWFTGIVLIVHTIVYLVVLFLDHGYAPSWVASAPLAVALHFSSCICCFVLLCVSFFQREKARELLDFVLLLVIFCVAFRSFLEGLNFEFDLIGCTTKLNEMISAGFGWSVTD